MSTRVNRICMPVFTPNNMFTDCWSSVGNVTFYHRDGKCFWRTKPQPVFPGTSGQLEQLDVHRRGLRAWKEISDSERKMWRLYAQSVPSHRPPFRVDNHISGHNLFMSAYHGFARLGCERTPAPQQFTQFPPFAFNVVSSGVEDGTMRIVCRVVMHDEPNPERFRLLGKIQLVKHGRSCHSGMMRTYLSEELEMSDNFGRLVRFTIPDYVSAWGLDLKVYSVHFRLILIDTLTGYRSQYQKYSSVVST